VLGEKKIQAISASASKDRNGVFHISLVNMDANNTQEITIDLAGIKAAEISGRILQSGKLQDYNDFENPGRIKPELFTGAKLNGDYLKATIPPFSVVVLALK
jgi:alpha-N-arabinofuranosidase